jgi:hypothetical protein
MGILRPRLVAAAGGRVAAREFRAPADGHEQTHRHEIPLIQLTTNSWHDSTLTSTLDQL